MKVKLLISRFWEMLNLMKSCVEAIYFRQDQLFLKQFMTVRSDNPDENEHQLLEGPNFFACQIFREMTRKAFIVLKNLCFSVLLILVLGLVFPQRLMMPVEGAGNSSFHPQSFWAYPWGKSVTHKGVDIFAREGTIVRSATYGIVLSCGPLGRGGNVVFVLGPKWRIHYYAHLKEITTSPFSLVGKGGPIGTVGTTGNAAGKPAHLHYSIVTAIPYPWRIDDSIQGWKKMFYLDPVDYLKDEGNQ